MITAVFEFDSDRIVPVDSDKCMVTVYVILKGENCVLKAFLKIDDTVHEEEKRHEREISK